MIAPLRPLFALADRPVKGLKKGQGPITRTYQALGGAPKPLVKLQRLDDTDFLAQLEAVDAFVAQMYAYPGRTFGQLYHRFIKGNDLREGHFELDDRRIELSAIRVPVLIFGGTTDGIAPIPCVRAGVPLLTGAEEVRFEAVPGGHLGMLTGRAARGTTWRVLDEWFTQWGSDRASAGTKAAATKPATKSGGSGTTSGGSGGSDSSGGSGTKKPSREAIGANPTRRYGSGGSRSLAR